MSNLSQIITESCACAARTQEHGASASPHIVIRGETLPHNKLAFALPNNKNNSDFEAPQAAHIDWLAFTLNPPPEASQAPIPWLLSQLFRLFNLPSVLCKETGKGWNGYTHRVNIGENAEYGLIAYGGEKQRGTIHVELNK